MKHYKSIPLPGASGLAWFALAVLLGVGLSATVSAADSAITRPTASARSAPKA